MADHTIETETYGNKIVGIVYDDRKCGGDLEMPVISWASTGSVSVQEARDFANAILDVCAQSQNIYAGLKND